MKVGIMQPYFWPYLGYFQLINLVDKFIIYDNIQYTKKGWINRNRYLCNGNAKYFTVPLEKDSDYFDVRERKVSENFDKEKVENQIKQAYIKAPYFEDVFPLFCSCVEYENDNLFEYIYYSVKRIVEYLEIETELVVSSTIGINHELKSKDKVIALCKEIGGTKYINPSGGVKLYDKIEFQKEGIELNFIRMKETMVYDQFQKEFVPFLSILDVLMFNSLSDVKNMLNEYVLF